MVQISKRGIGTGGVVNISQKDLDKAGLKVGDDMVLIAGDREILFRSLEKVLEG